MAELVSTIDALVVDSAKIVTNSGKEIDIRGLISAMSFSESIESVAIKGTVRIVDTVGLLEKTPLMGEETLLITMTGKDYDTKKKLELFVYKIDNVIPLENYAGVGFMMHVMTKQSFQAGASIITASFNKQGDQICQDIFDRAFERISTTPKYVANANVFKISNDREAVFETTEGDIRCIIPTYQPSEAMHFICTKAFSSKSTSCSFRFFETMNGFYFVTDEFLVRRALEEKKVKPVEYSSVISVDPENIDKRKFTLTSFVNSNRANTAQDIRSGAYASNILVVDFVNKTTENHRFRYKDDAIFTSMKGTTEKNFRHSDAFVNDVFNEGNEKRMIFFRDYDIRGEGQLKGEENIPLITSRKISYDHMIKSTAVSASIQGRLDIRAGDVLDVSILELNTADKRERNKQLSGNYVVHTCNQTIEEDKLTTNMLLIKYGWETSRV